jgi:hypothetical protein
MKINRVQKSRKPQGACEACRQPIEAGASYKFLAPRYGGKRKRHADCPDWRQSEMTNAKIATAYAGQEAAHDALDSLDVSIYDDADAFLDDVKTILSDCAEAAAECAADYQDGIDSMPEGLQSSPVAEESLEKIEILEGWQAELEDFDPDEVAPEQEEYEAPDTLACPECGRKGPQNPSEPGIYVCLNERCDMGTYDDPDAPEEGEFEEEFLAWADGVLDQARSIIDGLEL